MQALQIGAVVCASISLLLLLIALGSDYWVANALTNTGLWKLCFYARPIYTCGSYGMNVSGFIHATRAFMFFGMFAGAVSCISLCGTFFSLQPGSISKAKTAAIASFVAAGCILIAMAVFTGETGGKASYGWSFGLGWASFPLFLITAGCVLIAMAVFTGETGGNASYGWSFGLGWASFPLFLITGGLAYRLNAAATE